MAFQKGLTMDERVMSLFQPDTLIPEQYLETFRRRTHLEPEKRLMLALLEDGVACFQKYVTARDGRGKTIFKETEEWVGNPNGEGLFSFASVCENLGLDSDYLRRGLMRWKVDRLARATARVYEFTPQGESRDAATEAEPLHRLRKVANR